MMGGSMVEFHEAARFITLAVIVIGALTLALALAVPAVAKAKRMVRRGGCGEQARRGNRIVPSPEYHGWSLRPRP